MIDINYDEASKEFYVSFQGKRYNIANKDLKNLKDKINSIETSSLSHQNNEHQNLL